MKRQLPADSQMSGITAVQMPGNVAYNSQADAMHIRQVSAFTYNENKHGSVGEPTGAPEFAQRKWFEKQLFL